MLTSGGDCQALNAAMRGVVKTLYNSGQQVEIYGFLDGYRGLIYSKFQMLTGKDFSGILTKGGTMLGTSRTPFKTIQDPDENGLNKVEAMKQNYYKLQLDCLVILGGNGTHKTANLLRQEGKEEKGHLEHTLHLIRDLHDLHLQLLRLPAGEHYRQAWARLEPELPHLRAVMGNPGMGDTELCFRALYAVMLYRIKGQGECPAIADTIDLVSPVIGELAAMYGKVERGELDLFNDR